ncbi:hypothetical protein L3Q82_000052 [Scortum barcoo]|uniref:Uncharacterized protein n=1 Tax=Scortum barcoo TaxID=214431 RepID=A0ACB8XB10_9TELE|nr:hypothetical protein L3Q82_000052 [Scortum barcoo]
MRFSSWSWNSGPALYPPQGAWRVYGSLPNQSHMCFVDLEKAFDRVPKSWYSVGSAPRVWGPGPLLRAVRSLYDRSRSLVRIAGRQARAEVPVWEPQDFISAFADDVVLLAS